MSESWRDDALCKNTDPNLYDLDWIAETWGIRSPQARAEYAEQICAGCPVKRECALDALQHIDMGFASGCPGGGLDVVGTSNVVRAGVAVGVNRLLSRRLGRLALVAGVDVPRPVQVLSGWCFGCGRGFGLVERYTARVCVSCKWSEGNAA